MDDKKYKYEELANDFCLGFNFNDPIYSEHFHFAGKQFCNKYNLTLYDNNIIGNKHFRFDKNTMTLEKMKNKDFIINFLKACIASYSIAYNIDPLNEITIKDYIIYTSLDTIDNIPFDDEDNVFYDTLDNVNKTVLDNEGFNKIVANVENINITNINQYESHIYFALDKNGCMVFWIN